MCLVKEVRRMTFKNFTSTTRDLKNDQRGWREGSEVESTLAALPEGPGQPAIHRETLLQKTNKQTDS